MYYLTLRKFKTLIFKPAFFQEKGFIVFFFSYFNVFKISWTFGDSYVAIFLENSRLMIMFTNVHWLSLDSE